MSRNARMTGYLSQRKGKVGEEIAAMLMRAAGVKMVEKIATPIIVYARKRDWVKIAYTERVSGDWRGIMPDGRRVLAEVKSRDGNLRWSDLKAHQVAALDNNHRYNGVSLLVWIHIDFNVILRWPIQGFDRPRTSIRADAAGLYEWDGVN